MKKFTTTLLSWLVAGGALVALLIVPLDAYAQHRGGGGRSHAAGVRSHAGGMRSHTVHRGARVGVVIGAPIAASPWWYYPRPYYYGYDPYYYPPPVYLQEQPSVYIEQQAPAPQAAPAQYWYYCEASKTYFPYVQTCATPWQRVIPYPPQG